jgi:hypothetical protein
VMDIWSAVQLKELMLLLILAQQVVFWKVYSQSKIFIYILWNKTFMAGFDQLSSHSFCLTNLLILSWLDSRELASIASGW